MSESFIAFRVVYTDLPDLIELGVEMRHVDWPASASIYGPPSFLKHDPRSLIAWSRHPSEPTRLDSKVSPACGGVLMEFRTIDSAQHVRCMLDLSTRRVRPGVALRVMIEIPTELGLVEQFGHELRALGEIFKGEARLVGVLLP